MSLFDGAHDHLPRLPAGAYRGRAMVHWTFTLEKRKVGWLDEGFHAAFRWSLVHACARYEVTCPIYCLMPDHLHLMLAGQSLAADQLLACRFLRTQLGKTLQARGFRFQKQAYDHVLRDDDTEMGSFESVAWYVAENPVRAGCVERREAWPFTGAVVPGYPELSPWQLGYWDLYWRITLGLPRTGVGGEV